MRPTDIINAKNPDEILCNIMRHLHFRGPIYSQDLEMLSYLKVFHPESFLKINKKLMFLLGLFYKIDDPEDVVSFAYSVFDKTIREETSQVYTPVQASIRSGILSNKYFSFSAPTSAGKSFLLRDLVREQKGDIMIVVPSRALISEYMMEVNKIVEDNKDVLVLQFVDDINKSITSRRIFIVTPERAVEVFKYQKIFNMSLFLYDEAQISEEPVRGVEFDALVRRVERIYPSSKKVFAHPFIENPGAQFSKHNIEVDCEHKKYDQNVVGKMFFSHDPKKQLYERFSPYIEDAHLKKNKLLAENDISAEVMNEGGSMLVYVSKKSIYEKTFIEKFKKYIDMCDVVTDPKALAIISEIKELIGATQGRSMMVELMKRGVVIHHGSIPLAIRFLIEEFTASRFAKICFATSTLVQGVNMPFDLVWIDNFRFIGSEEDKTLGLKNLIGRAGRTTPDVNRFDHGYVVVGNVKTFVDRLNGATSLSEVSQLDESVDIISDDLSEFIDAIKDESINDEYSLPITKMERLRSDEARSYIVSALDKLFVDGKIVSGDEYRVLPEDSRTEIKDSFKGLFKLSINRELLPGEKAVLSRAISILLWQVQGKSFREILGLRYFYLTNGSEHRDLAKKYKTGELSEKQYEKKSMDLEVQYSPIARQLPDITAVGHSPSRFGSKFSEFNYDLLVYDTYDYMDKVISFSMSDVYCAAFGQFYEETKDDRALAMVNYFKYGTEDAKEIWLLRYGFSIEDIQQIKKHVLSIDENKIVFDDKDIQLESDFVKAQIQRYR